MNWYRVTKTIRGRKYDYWQKTYRLNGKVKTLNKYIGPTGKGGPVILAPGPIETQRMKVKHYSPWVQDTMNDMYRGEPWGDVTEVKKLAHNCTICGGTDHSPSYHDDTYPENCALCGKPNDRRQASNACTSCASDIPW